MDTTIKVNLNDEQIVSLLEDVAKGMSEDAKQAAHNALGATPKYIIQSTDPSDWSPKDKYELLNLLFGARNYSDKGTIIANVSEIIYCH